MPYLVKDKLRFLSEASKVLASSLDYQVTLAILSKILVENIADFCIIDILDDHHIERVVVKIFNARKQKEAQAFYNYLPDPKNKHAIYEAITIGKPILIRQVTERWLRSVFTMPEERNLVKKLGMTSFVFVPLKSREKVIGVLTLSLCGKKHYRDKDLLFLQELGSRAGSAVDKAHLHMQTIEAIRHRDEFLAIASHELKTPLTSISLNLQYMLKKLHSATTNHIDKEELIKLIEQSKKQSNRLSRLISDLLNISVVASGRLKIEKEQMDLVHVTNEIIAKYDLQAKKTNTLVVCDSVKQLVGYWDQIRIEQVLSNLLSNAIKYGNGKMIKISVYKLNHKAVLKIQDHGIGIPHDQQSTIFENYKRAVSGKNYKGLGIGLYISKQITEAHGGKLYLEKSDNTGTSFIMELPL